MRVSTCNLHGQKVKSGVTALISTVLVRHFVSTNGHFSQTNNGSSSYSNTNTNTTGSGRSSKVPNQCSQTSSDEKREDLNILVKKDAGNSVKYKKESDYGIIGGHRRGSRDKDDIHSQRRSRDSDFHHRRERDEYSSMNSSSRDRMKDTETDPWLEVGCKFLLSRHCGIQLAIFRFYSKGVSFGPIVLESASALPIPEHCLHLVQHK